MLTISVKNFGPIAEGSVDLKPLTIFVGPSNTGKSYMATAVYAVMRGAPLTENWVRLANDKTYEMSEELLSSLSNWAKQDLGSYLRTTLRVSNLSEILQQWVRTATSGHLNNYGDDVLEVIQELHGGSSSFVRRGLNAGDYCLTLSKEMPLLNLEIPIGDHNQRVLEFDISQSELPEYMLGSFPWALVNTKNDRVRAETVGSWIHNIATPLFGGFPIQVYYLPAGRSAITQARRAVSAEIILRHSNFGMRRESASLLPGAMTLFLSDLVRIERRGLTVWDNDELKRVVGYIESNVLNGEIDIDETSGLTFPEFVYLPAGTDLNTDKFSLDQTSSMVSELAPLILFLKYLVRPGHLLILEEPESHLHPAAQTSVGAGHRAAGERGG